MKLLAITTAVLLFVCCLGSLTTLVMGDASKEEEQQAPIDQQRQWAVRMEPGNDADQVALQHGFRNLGPVANLKDYFLFEAGSHHTKRDTVERSAQDLAEHPAVSWMEEQVMRQHVKKE